MKHTVKVHSYNSYSLEKDPVISTWTNPGDNVTDETELPFQLYKLGNDEDFEILCLVPARNKGNEIIYYPIGDIDGNVTDLLIENDFVCQE